VSHGESAIGERPTGDSEEENRIMRYYKQQYMSFLTTKNPRWSFISGIVYLGRTSSALMNMIMANVRYQASSTEKRIEDKFQALEHYQSGLRDFSGLVKSGQYDPLTILGTLFLLVQFGLQHAEHAKDISRHLEGFNSAVLTYGGQLIPGLEPFYSRAPGDSSPDSAWASSNINSPTDVPARYSNVLNRLGLWMGYMDALVSSWDLGGSVMSTFLDRFPGSFDSIFAGSRNVAGEIWGAEYPATEALDDLQNRPAFDLYHEAHILRYQVSRFRWAIGDEVESSRIRSEIISKIEELTEVRLLEQEHAKNTKVLISRVDRSMVHYLPSLPNGRHQRRRPLVSFVISVLLSHSSSQRSSTSTGYHAQPPARRYPLRVITVSRQS
jgi:hypothetical protein